MRSLKIVKRGDSEGSCRDLQVETGTKVMAASAEMKCEPCRGGTAMRVHASAREG